MSRLSSLVAIVALATGACRAAVPPWGSSLESAKRNADNTFAAFAFRFYNVQRDAKFDAARPRMAHYALIPSRLASDTSIWTDVSTDSVRSLTLKGVMTEKGYLFTAHHAAPNPERLGDERHFMRLTTQQDNGFEWYTRVDHAVGPVRASQVGAALGTLFTAFEGHDSAAIRSDVREHFPRTARHMGQVFTIDSLRSSVLSDGSTSLAMHVLITPDSVRGRYPAYAAYLDKYIVPTRARLQLTDHTGAQFVDLILRDSGFWVRLRAKKGELVSLAGVPRPMPDSLRMLVDASAKFMIFRVGFTNLVGDFTIERGEHERSWMMRFRREPNWDFPLATDRLIRSPLRRPFEGGGAELLLSVRDDLGAQATSIRQLRLAVKESAIMRWLGGLGSTAFGDYAGRSELEENRLLSDLFGALRQDVAALAP